MLTIALLLQAATPTPEAERLGVELARHGTLASLLPLIQAKETEELVATHPELSAADRDELRRTAAATYGAAMQRLAAAIGHGYAQQLTLQELRQLVAFYGTPAAARQHAVQPQVIARAMASIGKLDAKGDTVKAFCAKTGKLCTAK